MADGMSVDAQGANREPGRPGSSATLGSRDAASISAASGGLLWRVGSGRRSRKRCAVQAEAGRVAGLGREMARGLRRLKRSLRTCRDCARLLDSPLGECPRLVEFNAWVGGAINEVMEEWERG